MWRTINESKKTVPIIIIILTLIGAILRLYNILWDEGFFFHPDERNIGYGISKLNFAEGQFNPQFWAYGSLPIYTVYGIAWIIEQFSTTPWMQFDQYLTIGRYLSAICSIALIPLTYLLTKKLSQSHTWSIAASILAAGWLTFLPGMIQFAHVTTFETFLTLQYMLLLWFCFEIAQRGTSSNYMLAGTILGLSIGTKIISLALVPLIVLAHLFYRYHRDGNQLHIKQFFDLKLIVAGIIVVVSALAASPFHWLDVNGFLNSMKYESGVADGSLPVFYTQQFEDTIPIVYQLLKVFPYIFTAPLTLVSIVAHIYWLAILTRHYTTAVRSKQPIELTQQLIGLTISLILLYLAFHFSLYVKWTRYMIPALPFLTIITTTFLYHGVKQQKLRDYLNGGLSLWVFLAGLSFWQLYLQPDPRVQAASWAKTNISPQSRVTSEMYDLGITAFSPHLPQQNVFLAPLYDLESLPNKQEVIYAINQSDYYIVLSSRLWSGRLREPLKYPEGHKIYRDLLTQNGWTLEYASESRIIDCGLWSFYCFGGTILPDETFAVFDHPQLFIFRRTE